MALLVRESKYGMSPEQLIARTGLRKDQIEGAKIFAVANSWYVDRAWFQSARDRLVRAVREFHTANPLQPGMPKQDLRSRELPECPLPLLDALIAEAQDLAADGETVRARSHRVVLKEDEENARAAIEHAFEQAGLTVPAMSDVLAKSGVEAARARSLLQILLREKRLIRIGDDLVFHHSALDRLRAMLAPRKGQKFNVGAFKDWTGISRKYAIPLLEFLDREKVTRREGDERRVL
jgi:selenocysteine-specific elongation factor